MTFDALTTEQNLTDTTGEIIVSNEGSWYKIVLADGSELGLGAFWPGSPKTSQNNRTLVKVVPAGQGMVFRYQRTDGNDRAHQGWPIGDKGYLRGLQVRDDHSELILNMGLSWDESTPQSNLCMFDTNENYGIIAEQLPENRVALYAYNKHNAVCGLRVDKHGHIMAHRSQSPLALDCAFVRVGTSRSKGLF